MDQAHDSLLREWLTLIIETTLDEDDINEFSGAGAGGGLMGYSLPLGANPDDYGRQLNKSKKRKNKGKAKK